MGKLTKTVEYSLTAKKMEFKNVKIRSSEDAVAFARNFYFDDIDIFESVFLIFLNNANQTTGYAKISQGGLKSTVVDPKIVGKFALDSLADGVIMVHNHPSGNLSPSREDDNTTTRIAQIMRLIDSKLLDHIVITSSGHYSYADDGKSELRTI